MATHNSVLAWRIPGMGESCGLPSMGSHRVRHGWSDLAAAAAAAEIYIKSISVVCLILLKIIYYLDSSMMTCVALVFHVCSCSFSLLNSNPEPEYTIYICAYTYVLKFLAFVVMMISIPWRREWQPTPVLLSMESHGQRNLTGYIRVGKSQTWLSN